MNTPDMHTLTVQRVENGFMVYGTQDLGAIAKTWVFSNHNALGDFIARWGNDLTPEQEQSDE